MSHFKKSAGLIGTPDQRAHTGPQDSGAAPAASLALIDPSEPSHEATVADAAALLAAGNLLSEIAADLHTAIKVVNEAVQAPEPAALLVALRALLEKVGATADRAGMACGGTGMQEQDDWLLSPGSADDMAVLQDMRRQALAANNARGAA